MNAYLKFIGSILLVAVTAFLAGYNQGRRDMQRAFRVGIVDPGTRPESNVVERVYPIPSGTTSIVVRTVGAGGGGGKP